MDQRFIVGEVVRLKSAGGDMTVRRIDDDVVVCEWRDKGTVRRHDFMSAMLERGGEFADLGMLAIEGVTHTSDEVALAVAHAKPGDTLIAAYNGNA